MIERLPKIPRLINLVFYLGSHPGASERGLMERYGINARMVYRLEWCRCLKKTIPKNGQKVRGYQGFF